MPFQGWNQLLNADAPWQTTQGTALSTAATATISPQAPTTKDFVIATSYLYPGAVLRTTAQGFMTTTATSTTATFLVAAGATPTTLCTTAGITTGTTVLTGIQWFMQAYHRITAVASTGNTISSQGYMQFALTTAPALPANPQVLTGAGSVMNFIGMPNASGETAAAIDTTANMALMMRATLVGANATIQCTQFLIEHMD